MVDRPRRTGSSRDAAEAAFRAATAPKPVVLASPAEKPKGAGLPPAREMVSIRIDRDVLEHFQEEGPGWQERVNAALRKAAGLA